MPITLERIPHDKQVAVQTLHSLGYSLKKIAKSVDVSINTAMFITHQNPSNQDEVETYKKGLLCQQYGISQRAINHISDDKLDKMNALQLMTINAIGIDKARDMEGSNRPVFNIINVAADLSKRLGELKQKQAALLALQSEQI